MSKTSNNNYLSFEIDDELFGIDLINLNQIIETPELTKVPMSSKLLEGIILHNNEALPIINFRNWLTEKKESIGERKNVLVLELETENDSISVGIKVDKVIEVVHFEEDEITKVPEIGDGDSKHIKGMVKYREGFIMLIDINNLFTAVELKTIEGSTENKSDVLLDESTLINKYINTYLSFTIGKEKLAVDANRVIEILNVPEITKVPGSDEYLVGVVNIRGSVLPVIDPRKKFRINIKDKSYKTVTVMVLDVDVDGENQSVGTIVDSVTNIIEIDQDKINNSVSLDLPFNPEFLTGVAKIDDKFIQIMNVDKVFELDIKKDSV